MIDQFINGALCSNNMHWKSHRSRWTYLATKFSTYWIDDQTFNDFLFNQPRAFYPFRKPSLRDQINNKRGEDNQERAGHLGSLRYRILA